MAYVEGDLDRVCESRLDITRELDQFNGYHENQSVLLSPIGPIRPDPRLFEPALLNLFVGHFKHTIGSIRHYFRKTTTAATSGGQLGVRRHWPCLKIPSGDTVATFDPKTAQSGLYGSTRYVWNQTTTTATSRGLLGVGSH
ncbi:hypothetical protein CRG98_017850 [Punica granatum]|uniref:Uncharacterized protein n=1 Tax=Punica granatum TaxID=22663 RepID=A0A2I0JZJ1_PUNGR|nr:hypothetical protein CRG98_017850 [Punica granatum]